MIYIFRAVGRSEKIGGDIDQRAFEGKYLASILAKMGGGVLDCPAAPLPSLFPTALSPA